jgi:hypothetical protein
MNTKETKLDVIERIEGQIDLHDSFNTIYEANYCLEHELIFHDDFARELEKATDQLKIDDDVLIFAMKLRVLRQDIEAQ